MTETTNAPEPAEHNEGLSPSFWLELFFDLVVVAAMVVLATALEEHPNWQGIGIFSVTFTAIWMSWAAVALYVNAADARVERRTVLWAMAGIAVMAASLLDLEAHATTFALAFLFCRVIVFSGTLRSARMFVGWSAVMMGATVPWLVSIWVPAPWKFVLWAVGLAADLLALWRDRDERETLDRLNRGHQRRNPEADALEVAPLRTHHLAERLGTFVVIVLGESILQMVRATAETEWTWQMWVTAAAIFTVIVSIWKQAQNYGFLAAPRLGRAQFPVHSAMLSNLLSTGSLVVMAAGLGEILRHPDGHVEEPWGWIAAGGLAGYLAMAAVSGLRVASNRRWFLLRGLPAVLAVVVLGAVSALLPAWVFVPLLLIPLGWVVLYPVPKEGADGAEPAANASGTPTSSPQ